MIMLTLTDIKIEFDGYILILEASLRDEWCLESFL